MWRFVKLLWIFSILANSVAMIGKKSWNLEMLSVSTQSTNEKVVKFDIKKERVSRNVYGMTGTIMVNYDIEVGDDTMVEAIVYRSATGSSEYKITPFTLKKQHFYNFVDSFYKDILMESLHKCSDLPYFEDKFTPPFEKKTYTMNKCLFSNEGLPPYMNDGYYKILYIGTGAENFTLEFLFKIENEL